MFKSFSKEERSWILYDVANSAYTLAILTVFFTLLFKDLALEQSGISDKEAGSILAYATGIISIIIAILAPILGNLADHKGKKKRFFKIFLFMGLIFGVLLSIPDLPWYILLTIYVVATIGYSGANVFYDSFLTDVTSTDKFDKVSSNGYAWGYIGSVIPFIIGLVFYAGTMEGFEFINIGLTGNQAISIAFLINVAWWGIFSIPMLKNCEQKYYTEPERKWFRNTFTKLGKTIKKISKQPHLLLFLLGYFFYIDAVYTIIKSAVNLGTALDITSDITLVIMVLLVQFIAFPCAIIFGILSKKIGDVKMLSFGVIIYIIICTIGTIISETWHLYLFVGLVGLAQGGVQAVSRSYFGKLIPKENSAEYFGFFNIFGKFASIIGPFLVAVTIKIDPHYATLALIPLLVIGLILLILSAAYKPKTTDMNV